MTAHTPGPWTVNAGHSDGYRIQQTLCGSDSARVIALVYGRGEHYHDAVLVKAAPDLLAACRDALALLEDDDADILAANRVQDVLCAAIAKATVTP